MLNIGKFKINLVNDLIGVKRDPSHVYPNVTKGDWYKYKSFAQNSDGTIQSTWRGYLLESEGKNILIDTGMGPGPYDHTDKTGELLSNLLKLGKKPEDIDFVFITHTHGDHIGWNITWKDNSPNLTFPNAKYLVSKYDFDFYTENPNEDFEKQIYPLRELGALELIEGRTEIIKDVFSLPANGHTPGHQCLCLETQDDEKIILTGDLFHNEAQINEQFWCPIFDWNTMMSTISRVGLLNSAYKNQWIVCTGHLSDEKAIGRIKSNNDGFYWQPI
ncbi:MAG: hypothetical protein CL728_04410 [Chloroflexi bacterium]|jgi:glyoxylase-like metal-dependent hydrolase (beta-lactamase superfamily II)|nr:hypothetical protein [Chloroflexota bacterium]|tara:strand:+ start:840 stop:1661 length:822 start_codon:yes stop_codon:yes gene_type:complete